VRTRALRHKLGGWRSRLVRTRAMQLPGRLRSTTLGDLLGTLHRARSTGTLELAEFHGRTHRVHLSRGLVVAVELDGPVPSLAEELRREGAVGDDVLKR